MNFTKIWDPVFDPHGNFTRYAPKKLVHKDPYSCKYWQKRPRGENIMPSPTHDEKKKSLYNLLRFPTFFRS